MIESNQAIAAHALFQTQIDTGATHGLELSIFTLVITISHIYPHFA